MNIKKLIAAATIATGFLTYAQFAFAQQVDVQIKRAPNVGIDPATGIGTILSNILILIFTVAALAVLFMLIWGAFQWITSGGEKESVGKARGRIIAALIGLAVLAVAFLITRVAGQIVGIDPLNLRSIPRLDRCNNATQVFDPEIGECVNRTDTTPPGTAPATRPGS